MNTIYQPRVWIGALGAYNEGTLHGEWLDPTHWGQFTDDVQAIIATSPVAGDEEFYLGDVENFGDYPAGEYTPLEELHQVALLLERHGDKAVAFADAHGWHYIDNYSDPEIVAERLPGEEPEHAIARVWADEHLPDHDEMVTRFGAAFAEAHPLDVQRLGLWLRTDGGLSIGEAGRWAYAFTD